MSVEAILDHTGAGRTRAYAQQKRLQTLIVAGLRGPGRPPVESPDAAPACADMTPVTEGVVRYLMSYPGAVTGKPSRRRYSDGFRRHVVALCSNRRHQLHDIARAICIPLSTLRRWMNGSDTAHDLWNERQTPALLDEVSGVGSDVSNDGRPVAESGPVSQTAFRIVRAWSTWHGSLTSFCQHLVDQLHIHIGRAAVSRILAVHGVRAIKRRAESRKAYARAMEWRDSFVRFFPGAQWTGDGTQMTVWLDEQPHIFNIELMVDTANGAVVGASIRDTEDGEAVIEAFHDGIATTGAAPLSLLLDNRPSNLGAGVLEALGDTKLLLATPRRPQNKAHVEGAFGLFKQSVPRLRLTCAGAPQRQQAQEILAMAIKTWARTLNHRRPVRGSRLARVDLYGNRRCTPAQAQAARSSLGQRQYRAQQRRYGSHPLHDFVSSELTRLGLVSATSETTERARLLRRILRFPDHAIVDGIAIFEAKRAAGTLPACSRGRYLIGIMRRLAESGEGTWIAQSLWDSRQAANKAWRKGLETQRDKLERHTSSRELVIACIDATLKSTCTHERNFWLHAAASAAKKCQVRGLFPEYKRAALHILSTYSVPYRQRLTLIRDLLNRLAPLPG